jgi:hypothetical protein
VYINRSRMASFPSLPSVLFSLTHARYPTPHSLQTRTAPTTFKTQQTVFPTTPLKQPK